MATNKISHRRNTAWTNERRKAASDRMKVRMNQPEAKAKAAARMAAFNSTDTARQSRSKTSSANWKNPELRSRMRGKMLAARARYFKTLPDNSFESRCYTFLDEFGFAYDKQHPIIEADTIPDAFFSEINLCVYFDSEYWHSRPGNAARDDRIRKHLVELGYQVKVIRCDRHAREINESDLDAIRSMLCPAS